MDSKAVLRSRLPELLWLYSMGIVRVDGSDSAGQDGAHRPAV